MLSTSPLVSLSVAIWKAQRRSLKLIFTFSPLSSSRGSSATVLAGRMIAAGALLAGNSISLVTTARRRPSVATSESLPSRKLK